MRRFAHPLIVLGLSLTTGLGCLDNAVTRTIAAQQYCEEQAEIDCDVYWNCYTQAEQKQAAKRLGGEFGTDEASCIEVRKGVCPSFACSDEGIFQEMKAAACVDAQRVVTCETWSDGLEFAETPLPPACAAICIADPLSN